MPHCHAPQLRHVSTPTSVPRCAQGFATAVLPAQDAVVVALMQADEHSLKKLSWLQDLPQRIQHHRQRQQQQQLHGSQEVSDGEDEALGEDESQEGGITGDAQVALLYERVVIWLHALGFHTW